MQIHGREMQISHFDKEQLKRDQVNLFVKNLGDSATNASLYSLFKSFGNIFSSKLAQDTEGKSKGYGFVQYMMPEQAKTALNEMNGKQLNETTLLVEPFKRKKKSKETTEFCNLYIKNLPENVRTSETLDKMFETFGERVSVSISQSELKGKVNYFGFVAFKRSEDATRAVREMNGKKLDNNTTLYVGKALSKLQRQRHKRIALLEEKERMRRLTLFAKSITGSPLTEEFLRDQLEEFGKIKQASVVKRKDSQGIEVNLPIAFVVFEKEEDIKKALTEYHKKSRPLVITQLEKKENRKERLKRARAFKKKSYTNIQKSYASIVQQMRGRIFGSNPVFDMAVNNAGMRIRPNPINQLVHSYPQRLAVP